MSHCWACLLTLLMHPVHETVAELEWNAESKRLEVALRLSLLDEQWIRQQHPKMENVGQAAIEYLQKRFQVDPITSKRTAEEKAPRYHWVGREEQGSHVWWYFEIEPSGGQAPKVISSRMLLERDDRYRHRVIVLGRNHQRATTLTPSKPTAKLSWTPDRH